MTEKSLSFPILEFSHLTGLDPEWALSSVFSSRVGFRLGGKREDARLSEVTGLCGKSGYLCPLVAWVHTSTKAFLTWEGLEPGVKVAGFGIC